MRQASIELDPHELRLVLTDRDNEGREVEVGRETRVLDVRRATTGAQAEVEGQMLLVLETVRRLVAQGRHGGATTFRARVGLPLTSTYDLDLLRRIADLVPGPVSG